MSITEMQRVVQYVTDSQGNQTSVVIPISVWEEILGSLRNNDSSSVDEDDSKEQILTDLIEAMRSTRLGETFPIDQLWEKVYE